MGFPGITDESVPGPSQVPPHPSARCFHSKTKRTRTNVSPGNTSNGLYMWLAPDCRVDGIHLSLYQPSSLFGVNANYQVNTMCEIPQGIVIVKAMRLTSRLGIRPEQAKTIIEPHGVLRRGGGCLTDGRVPSPRTEQFHLSPARTPSNRTPS